MTIGLLKSIAALILAAGVLGATATAASAAPAAATPAQAASRAAAPWTSPTVPHYLHHGYGSVPCGSGHACAVVPYGADTQYIFDFYNYGSYALHYWHGSGELVNHQTGGAAVRLYDGNGRQVRCISPDHPYVFLNWDPIWTIRLTESGC